MLGSTGGITCSGPRARNRWPKSRLRRRLLAIIWRDHTHGYEGGVLPSPGERLSFSLKESVDDEGVFLVSGAPTLARSFAIPHRRTGIDRYKGCVVGEDYLATVRNFAWIDRAMAGSQSRTGGGFMLLRVPIRTASTAGPVDSDTREQGLLGCRLEQGWTGFRGGSRERLLPRLQQRLRARRHCRRRLLARERGRYQQQNKHGYCDQLFHFVFLYFRTNGNRLPTEKSGEANQGSFKWYSKGNVNLVVLQRLITRRPANRIPTLREFVVPARAQLVFGPATSSTRTRLPRAARRRMRFPLGRARTILKPDTTRRRSGRRRDKRKYP